MSRKYRNLIGSIADYQNVLAAAEKARKGSPNGAGTLAYMDHLEPNAALLSHHITNRRYTPGAPRRFVIYEPKRRLISALPFRDRVAQHAINNVIEPVFTRTFYAQSYGCIKGQGTHAGAIKCQSLMRKLSRGGPVWVLKTDFSGYFYNIDRAVLHRRIRAKISCQATLDLIEQFVPPEGVGISIGDLLSQLFANVYGTIADEWLLHHAKRKHFIRYMDDIVIYGSSQREMLQLKDEFEAFCAREMGLALSKWSVTPATRGVNFLGYRIWPTHKLMRTQSVTDAKKKIRSYMRHGEKGKLQQFLSSWLGHAKWADSANPVRHLKEVELCLPS